MEELKETNNPVGKVIQNDYIDMFIGTMKSLWDATKTTTAWWKVWKRVSIVPVTNFLIKCLDDLITYTDQNVQGTGADKKATVMWAIGNIYDYIIKESMPIWLMPFASSVRVYVINVMISAAIDWIVEKYRNGDWRPKPAAEIEARWMTLNVQYVK